MGDLYDKILRGELSSGDAANEIERLEAELAATKEAHRRALFVIANLEPELAAANAKIARVEAVHKYAQFKDFGEDGGVGGHLADKLRAALDDPPPQEGETK